MGRGNAPPKPETPFYELLNAVYGYREGRGLPDLSSVHPFRRGLTEAFPTRPAGIVPACSLRARVRLMEGISRARWNVRCEPTGTLAHTVSPTLALRCARWPAGGQQLS